MRFIVTPPIGWAGNNPALRRGLRGWSGPRESATGAGRLAIRLVAPEPASPSVRRACRDEGEIGVGEKVLAHGALLLEQFEAHAALLAPADGNRIHDRIDADEFVDVLLELVEVLD